MLATILLTLSMVGLIVILDNDEWMTIGRKLADGITRD